MQSGIDIRTATMADSRTVARLLRELDDHHVRMRPDVFQAFDDDTYQTERIRRFVQQDDASLFLAASDSKVVGLATVRISHPAAVPMLRPVKRAYIDDLVVNSGYQRLGVARMLIDHVSAWARSRELQAIAINVWRDNQAGMGFFTSNGFAAQCQQMELKIDNSI